MRFDFSTAGRIVFGQGVFADAPSWVNALGKRVLIVTGSDMRRSDALVALLGLENRASERVCVVGEPSIEAVEHVVSRIRSFQADSVIGFGGGSPIDAAKAAAALATNPGPILDYLEIVGRALPLQVPPLAMVAIPTTAGTGAEVTRNAVLTVPLQHLKVSLRGSFILPKLALVDPALALGLPASATATAGMDALTQLIEACVSSRANAISDGFAMTGLNAARSALRLAVRDGNDCDAREAMALAALMSGLALTSAGLGVVHGFASPIGGAFSISHGAICAALLAPAMFVNVRACRDRATDGEGIRRFTRVARILTDRPAASPEEGVEWVRRLVADLNVGGLRRLGVTQSSWEEMAAKAATSNSMKGNPVALLPKDYADILRLAD